MDQSAYDVIRYARSYLTVVTPYWALAALCIGGSIPLLQKIRPNGPATKKILFAYIVLMFSSLFLLNMLGIGLNMFAPETFETWRTALNSGANGTIPSMMIRFIVSLPLAFAATSVSRGLFGGHRQLLTGLLGIGLAAALGIIVVIGLIYVGCAGWSSCP